MVSPRNRQPELMDQPDLDAAVHGQALAGLARINALSRSAAILWPAIRNLAREVAPQPLKVLDVATGGGDVPRALARRANRNGLTLEIAGCDLSRVAVEYATRRAAGAHGMTFFSLDALNQPLPSGYHVVTCSLFLHHLDHAQAQELLKRMAAATQRLLLVNDLRRTRAGYALAWIGTRVLSRSPIVHVDGPRSVAGAFTLDELRELARQSGLVGASVSPRWPQRMLLTWKPN